MERLTLAAGQQIKQSAVPRTRLNVTNDSTTGAAEMKGRERRDMLAETRIAFVILVGGVPNRSGRLRLSDAYAQVRGGLRLREARRMCRKTGRAVECAGSDTTARGRIGSRDRRTTWIVSL